MAKWSLPIARYVEAAKGDLNKAARAVALELHTRIVVRTPVDTGRARGNWMIGLNAVPGPSGDLDRGGQATIDQGDKALSGFRLGDTIQISNTLPYIVELERGHSTQAPAGMVRVTLAEFGAITDAQARRVRQGGV